MAQTTGGMSFRAAKVDVSADGETWTEVSGHGAGVAVSGGDRAHGTQHTFEGDTPIVKSGKRDEITVVVRYVYTETADEPFAACKAIYETAGAACWVRYLPKGGDTDYIFETGEGIMTTFQYPQGEPQGGEVVLGEFSVVCAALTQSVADGGS